MTTSNLMSLPIDIPWKRLGTSKDMMDNKPDRRYPIKWRSSLSIFYYEPPAEEQKLDDRIITYIKVSCTITGFQKLTEGPEVSMLPKDLLEPWKRVPWHNYYKSVSPYFPCYGAMLQVAVFPGVNLAQQLPLEKFPFIVDFEPKKREMYESATEAEQFMSQSRSGINVKKGMTSTENQEQNYNFGGFFKGSIGIASAGVNASGGTKWGTSTETVDQTTADYSREKRENYSYTTNISHMYHLMKGYHLGTNRALFLMLPRPHIMDSEYTFVNGPRKLEGIQEFFLTVERPSDVASLCVEATLETAHLEAKTVWIPKVIPASDLLKGNNYQKTAKALALKESKGRFGKHLERIVYGWWEEKGKEKDSFTLYGSGHLRDGSRVCLRRGWNDLSLADRSKLIAGYKKGDYASVFGTQEGAYWYFKPDNVTSTTKANLKSWTKEIPAHLMGLADWVLGNNDKVGAQNAEVIYERGHTRSGTLFLTGRTTTNCFDKPPMYIAEGLPDFLTWEKKIDVPPVMDDLYGKNSERATAANIVSEEIGHEMIESLSSTDRLPYGEVEITEADFVQEPIMKALVEEMPDDDSYNMILDEIEDLDPKLRSRLVKVFEVKTRKEALSIEPYQLRSGLGLTKAEAKRLCTQLIGKGPHLEAQPGAIIVPNVVGMSLEEAQKTIAKARLTASDKFTYEDALELRDAVLNQFPNAGTAVKKGEFINLVVSSGPVAVPDVVGLNVDEATVRLKELSLRVETCFAVSDEQPEGHVLETIPSANTEVLRNSQLVLLVAKKAQTESQKTRSLKQK